MSSSSPTLGAGTAWQSLYPFGSNWISTAFGDLHYLDQGPSRRGPAQAPGTLLFVHGNPTWSFHWRRLIQALQNEFRCLAPDHLGCGLSAMPTRPLTLADRVAHVVQLVDELDLQRVTLVAQDWGGAIGLGAALERSERFERIVLFNTGAFPPWFIPLRIRVCRWPLIGRLAVQGAGAFSRAALRMTLARRRHLDSDIAAGYLAPYDSWDRRAAVYQFVRDIPATPRHPTWNTLATLESDLGRLGSLPIRLIWGMRDWCFTPACLDRFAEIWPDADLCRLADVGHWVVEDAPDQALALLRDFLPAASSTAAPA